MPGWWGENFFAIRDAIWAIYFKVEEPDAGQPGLDALFRKLRKRIDRFEAQCRERTAAHDRIRKRVRRPALAGPSAAKGRPRRRGAAERSRA
jgi:hypothetical protein